MTSFDNGGGATPPGRYSKVLGGIGLVKLLRYYDTKALRSNSRISKSDLQYVILNLFQDLKNKEKPLSLNPSPLRGEGKVVGRHYKTNNEIDKEANTNYNSNMMNYKSETLKQVQDDKEPHYTHFSHATHVKRAAFTLAEVLIILGIIGVVAALTIPTISRNIQHAVLKNQFKKFYSSFWQAVIGIQAKEGRPVQCYYWDGTNPYTGKCTPTCDEDDKNQYGNCKNGTYYCNETGDPLPADLNGKFSECSEFHEELFLKTLKTTKICKNKAYEQGCLPEDFRGANIVKSEQNPDKEYDPNGLFSDSSVKNNYPVFVLADGTYIIEYYAYLGGIPIYVVDINGTKGPNKWGYDILSFGLTGNSAHGITSMVEKQFNYANEEGGKYFQQMYNEAFHNKK